MPGPTTIGSAWRAARDRLKGEGIDTASLDARLLAEAAFGLDTVHLTLRENDIADTEALARYRSLVMRRLRREPVARILGEAAFYGLTFALSPETLVPRPETELIVELALAALEGIANPHLADLGTGTGCIAIAVLANLPDATAVATDLSPDALATARVNAARHGVAARMDFRHGDWLKPLGADERFHLILSNPPYIAHADIGTLDLDVRENDPHRALDGGSDGLDPYGVLAAESGAHLQPGGRVIVEHGAGQSDAVSAIFGRHGFVGLRRHSDLAGHIRALEAISTG